MANYDHYKIFCKIAELGSISKAAENLYVSQPAVSLVIKQLESELNVQLFFRTQKGVIPTAEGELLYSYVKQGCNIINTGEEKIKELTKLDAGEVRIGASDMTLRFFLLPYIEMFHKMYPNVKIKVSNAPTPTTVRGLREGSIDFGTISGPLDPIPNFNYREVKTIRDILVANDLYKSLRGKSVALSEIAEYPYIILEKGTSTRRHLEQYFLANGVEIKPEIELATSDLIIEFAKRGMGLAFILDSFAEDLIASGELFEINLKPAIEPRQFYIITHKDIPLTSASKKFLELIKI